ncbi:MAG: TolC family protein [Nitrospira sp.]|jgi:cobalt-zinc-cadmium efflux system outer membrane protein|nr:TolC family protein [Nitrospira sp.]TKB73609.1 MAG: TolC family protein [Nitrospira sp.]
MPTRLWNCVLVVTAMAAMATSGVLMPSFTQAKEEMLTFDLDRIIELALERNPAILRAKSVIDENEGMRTQAGAYPNPTIGGQTGSGALRDPSTGPRVSEYGMTLQQTVEWPGMRAARQDAADAGLSGATVGLDEAKLNLIAEVKGIFYELLLAERTVDLLQQNLEIVQEVARIVRARVRSGEGPQFEAVKADVEVLKAKQEMTKAKNAVRVKLVALDTLTSGALGFRYKVQGDFRSLRDHLDPERLAARDLSQHPVIKRQSKLVEQAEFTVTKERQGRVPNVTLFGAYARETGREGVVAGVSLPTPIWYRQQGHIAAALGTQRKEEAELVRTRNELTRAINQHAREAETAQEQILVYEEGLIKQAQEALRIAQLSFRQGASSLLDVLDAQRVQRQITVDYNQARFELSLALTRFERAVGGSL